MHRAACRLRTGTAPALVASCPTAAVAAKRWARPGDPMAVELWGETARQFENNLNSVDAPFQDRAPRAVGDFEMKTPDQVIPGAHPLPLKNADTESLLWPLSSPYMPSPNRVHPYFQSPLEEFPHFDCSVPVVYPAKCLKVPIIVPVFNTADGSVSHTRQLDPYVFGQYPLMDALSNQAYYWVARNQNYKAYWELGRLEIFRKSKKNWNNTGTGLGRVSDRKHSIYPWGGRKMPNKPWNLIMPTADPERWHTACRMTLALKILQGKVQVVDRLTLPEPTTAAFRQLCERMQWDVRSTGAGVMFMDGGSRLMPSMNFDKGFFYGSFINGRVKVVRPTIQVAEPFDWDRRQQYRDTYHGPKGQKNPVPINRFNVFDALEHHTLVLTEGAVIQLEQEMFAAKVQSLPPHIRTQMAEFGMLDHHLLGTVAAPVEAVEMEAAGRVEEREKVMYAPYYDNPYKPWADEANASYEVDAAAGYIRRKVQAADGIGSSPGSWRKIE
jgi:ribosomal protein L4